MERLDGKLALITGAARGIGRGFAQRVLAEGARVAVADINGDVATQTARELGDGAYAVQTMSVIKTALMRRGESLVLVYYSTKAAVISMTQSAGLTLIQHGINVNAIAPGVVDGEHWVHVDAMFGRLAGKAPGQKQAEVAASVLADLTGMAVFLSSSESDCSVSQTSNVDGGQWMS